MAGYAHAQVPVLQSHSKAVFEVALFAMAWNVKTWFHQSKREFASDFVEARISKRSNEDISVLCWQVFFLTIAFI